MKERAPALVRNSMGAALSQTLSRRFPTLTISSHCQVKDSLEAHLIKGIIIYYWNINKLRFPVLGMDAR